ncbi:hypothetical protein Pyrfu_0327 [Pyrolobus fumarii 1A]|uniref:Helicase HerA central domain-containing protein n=1 Tax=Pyrolobus fumarii (strain DSM 11204 / 1A) TaxID=694429 RepID=G0EFM8_PYRF1|nr:DUF87 domain-containing protein [Pyrolobus fumarii]AEM38199.1 hypothetical protein Pyrfu_0327 [Pyrolobus fumarii 1A]
MLGRQGNVWRFRALELLPHPEIDPEPLALEHLLARLHRGCFEVVHDGRHLRLYLLVAEGEAGGVKKALQDLFEGRLVVVEARPPEPPSRGWVGVGRLERGFYHPLFKHTEKKPVSINTAALWIDAVEPGVFVQICWEHEPRAKSVIAEWVYNRRRGGGESTVKMVVRELLDLIDPSYSPYDELMRRQHYMMQRHLLPVENEEVRQAEAKLMHRLYAVAVRVVADDKGKVERVCEAFHQFHYNNIVCRIKRLDEKMLERIRRREVEHLGVFFRDKRLPVLTPKELAALVNVPRPVPSLPVRLGIAVLEPPPEIVKIGELPGELSFDDLRRLVGGRRVVPLGLFEGTAYGLPVSEFSRAHKAIFGTTGAGKSSYARYLMLSLLAAEGCGRTSIVYIDPNGDDALKLVKSLPEECVDRLVYIDPRTVEYYGRVVKINFLEYREPAERDKLQETFLGAVAAYFQRFWGPRTEHLMRMAVKLVLSAPPGSYSLSDVYRVFVDEETRARFLEYVEDDEVAEFWEEQYPALLKKAPDAVQSVLNKLGKFTLDPLIRPFVEAKRSTVDLGWALDNGYIVVVNMGALKGTESLNFFGSLILSRIFAAAYARGERGEEDRPTAFVFVDELHNFVSPALARLIAQMMAETRKFRVFLVAMTQYPRQLPERLRAALYELAKHVFTFQVGLVSARELRKLYEPYATDHDLINLPDYTFIARIRVGKTTLRPFTLRAPYIPVELGRGNPYLDDPVVRSRIEESLGRHGAPVSTERVSVEAPVSPLEWRILVQVEKSGLTLGRLAEQLGLVRAAQVVESLRQRGFLELKGEQLILTSRGEELLDFSTRHGGGWHREAIRSIAEELAERGYYVVVDKAGGEDRPDIVALKPLDDEHWGEALCVEVVSDPERHMTHEYTLKLLKRCVRAGCGRLVIVVDRDPGVVEERLRVLQLRLNRVAAALGADPDLLAELLETLEVRVVPTAVGAEGEEEEASKVQGESVEAKAGGKSILEKILDELPRLLEEGSAFRKKEFIALTSEAVKHLGYQSLSQLYSELRNSGIEAVYKTVWYRGRSVRVVALPAKLLEQQ